MLSKRYVNALYRGNRSAHATRSLNEMYFWWIFKRQVLRARGVLLFGEITKDKYTNKRLQIIVRVLGVWLVFVCFM